MSYHLIENPIRNWTYLRRSSDRSISLGLILITASLLVATIEIANHSGNPAFFAASPAVSPTSPIVGSTSQPEATSAMVPLAGGSANKDLAVAAAAVLRSIRSAAHITSIPTDLVPSLPSFANDSKAISVSGTAYISRCDANGDAAEAIAPRPCIFGDIGSDKTIVLVGDSNVGNWAPGLDVGLRSSGYRLAVFAFAGCPTPDLFYPSYSQLPSSVLTECNVWHSKVLQAIRATHPIAVIAASGEADLSGISSKEWVKGFRNLFDGSTLGSPSTVRILLGTSPFPAPTPNCLTATYNPQRCSLHDSAGSGSFYSTFLARDPIVASAANATLIPTYPWFCYSGTCSPIVSKYLVFADQDHSTIAYGQYLAPVITEAVITAIIRH